MRRSMMPSRFMLAGLPMLLSVGCGGTSGPAGLVPEMTCADLVESIYADPGTLPMDKGAIIKCAKDKELTVAQLKAMLAADAVTTEKPVTSGARVYRIS